MKRVQKIFFALIALLVLGGLFSLPQEAAAAGYYWQPGLNVYDSGNKIYYKMADSNSIGYSSLEKKYPSLSNYLLISDKPVGGEDTAPRSEEGATTPAPSPVYTYLVIPFDNPGSGFLLDSGYSDNTPTPVSISDTDSVGPLPKKLITKGVIWGMVFGDENFDKAYSGGSVKLIFDNGGYTEIVDFIEGGDDRELLEKAANGGHPFNPFTLAKSKINGLYEGRYRLYYYHKEQCDLISGDPKGSPLQQIFNTCEYKGIVNFDLTMGNDGWGKISFVGNSGEHEKESKADTTNITSPEKGIFMDVTSNSDAIFAKALQNVIKTVLDTLNYGIQWTMGIVTETIAASGDVVNQPGLSNIMKGVRNTALSVLTLGLLLIAFANILSIDLEKYGLNRMIPKIIIAIVMIFFSLIIAQFLLELATALTAGLLTATSVSSASVDATAQAINTFVNSLIGYLTNQNLAQALFVILLLVGLLCVCLWVALILFVRKVVIIFLVAIAPIAFMMQIMPFTESLYKQWWSRFFKWVFMGPAIAFFLYMGNQFLINGYFFEKLGGRTLTKESFLSTGVFDVDAWSFLILTAVCWGIAAFVPLTMGKDVFGSIKNAWGKSGKMPLIGTPKRWLDKRASNVEAAKNLKLSKSMSRVARVGARTGPTSWAARKLVGMTPGQAAGASNAVVNEKMKEIEEMNLDKKTAQSMFMASTEPIETLALARFISSKGWHDDESKKYLNKLNQNMDDPIVAAHVSKEQPAIFSSFALDALNGGPAKSPKGLDYEAESAKATGKAIGKLEDLTHQQVTVLKKTAEGRRTLVGLLQNKQRVLALNEKGRERTLAVLGDFLENELTSAERIEHFGRVDRDHEKALGTIVQASHNYKANNKDPESGLPKNPWHEVK